jgi:hypothetical protein
MRSNEPMLSTIAIRKKMANDDEATVSLQNISRIRFMWPSMPVLGSPKTAAVPPAGPRNAPNVWHPNRGASLKARAVDTADDTMRKELVSEGVAFWSYFSESMQNGRPPAHAVSLPQSISFHVFHPLPMN